METALITELVTIYRLGTLPNKLEFCQVAVLGISSTGDPLDTDSYELVFRPRSFNVPLWSLETFCSLSDMYPPELLENIKARFENADKNTLEKNVTQVKNWESEAMSLAQIRRATESYI